MPERPNSLTDAALEARRQHESAPREQAPQEADEDDDFDDRRQDPKTTADPEELKKEA